LGTTIYNTSILDKYIVTVCTCKKYIL
jgi:hypothetical protein